MIILGIVQVLPNLLPISGTAHLCGIVPTLLGVKEDPGTAFSAAAAMRLVALGAVVAWNDIGVIDGASASRF
jgi:undecaprenyl pyrophosphate phosphatase UppP